MIKIKQKQNALLKAALTVFILCLTAAAVFGRTSLLLAQSEQNLGPESLFEVEQDAIITPNTDAPPTAVAINGINVLNIASGGTVKFKNPIDIASNTLNDTLVCFLITPEVVGVADFHTMEFTFTDVSDAQNYVKIKVFYHQWIKQASYYQLSYPGVSYRALAWGSITDTINAGTSTGLEILKSMNGTVHTRDTDGIQEPMVIRYDNAQKAFFADDYNGSHRMILKLDDPRHVGAGNEWQGFSSGLVNMTVRVSDFKGSSASYMLFNVNGNDLNGTSITDKKAPSLRVSADEWAQLPEAAAGENYPVYSHISFDEIDGDMQDKVQITVSGPGIPQGGKPVTSGGFTPGQHGYYTLKYTALDVAGNFTEKVFILKATIAPEPLSVQLVSQPAQAVKTGERVYIPGFTITGGSGAPQCEIKVSRVQTGKEYAITPEGYFIPDLTGEYCISYTVSDYIGKTDTFLYYTTATRGNLPICYFLDSQAFPVAFIAAKSARLPETEAYDYTSDPLNHKAAGVRVSLKYNGDSNFTPLSGMEFTPASGKTSVSVKYEVFTGSAPGADNTVEKIYADIPIVTTAQFDDYFIKDNSKFEIQYNKTSIGFSALSDAVMTFITPLSAQNFAILFNIPNKDSSSNNFTALNITLTDSLNFSQRLSLSVRKTDSRYSDVIINGTRYQMLGTFIYQENTTDTPFALKFDNTTFELTDYANNVITKYKTGADGLPFKGFTSGKVILSIGFEGVDSSGGNKSVLELQRIVNQSIFARILGDSELLPMTDNTAPLIERSFEPGLTAQLYQNIKLPSAKAFDVLDGNVSVTLTVRAPDNSILLDKAATGSERYIYAGSYGLYTVTYTATDNAGRPRIEEYLIVVSDTEAPDVTILGELPAQVNIGAKHDIPAAVVQDNLTANPVFKVFVVDTRLKMRELTDLKGFSFDKCGSYTFIYYTLDEADNYTMKTLTVTVK